MLQFHFPFKSVINNIISLLYVPYVNLFKYLTPFANKNLYLDLQEKIALFEKGPKRTLPLILNLRENSDNSKETPFFSLWRLLFRLYAYLNANVKIYHRIIYITQFLESILWFWHIKVLQFTEYCERIGNFSVRVVH